MNQTASQERGFGLLQSVLWSLHYSAGDLTGVLTALLLRSDSLFLCVAQPGRVEENRLFGLQTASRNRPPHLVGHGGL